MSSVNITTLYPGLQAATDNSAKDSWQSAPAFPIAEKIQELKLAVFEASQCKTQLDAALVYAKWGVPVFPCNWKTKNGSPKINKHPVRGLGEGGLYLATIDTGLISEWWTEWPLALIGVPGGRRIGVWFLDVDSAEGHGVNGLEAWWNLVSDHPNSANTRAHQTGTKGEHEIFLWDADRPVGCATGQLPEGIDVKGEGGYVIFPPSPYMLGDKELGYRVVIDTDPAQAPDWLYDLILGKRQKLNGKGNESHGPWVWSSGFGQKKLDHYCELVRTAAQHHWDESCREIYYFGRLCGGGAYSPDLALKELLKHARANPTAPLDYSDESDAHPGAVKRSFLRGVADPTGPFHEEASLDDFLAYLPQHSYIYIPTRELWPAASINATVPTVDDKLKASLWLDQNRPVQQMTWAPGEEMLVHGRLISDGGWFDQEGVACFNLYRPPIISGGDPKKADPWLDLVKKVYPDDADHIIKWCAQRVQHPEIKINHCIMVIGAPGIGKDTILEALKRAVGPWNFNEVSPQHLLGRFNGFLKSTVLRVNEARDLGEMNRYAFYEHMKTMAASPPDTMRIDEKNLREHQILNCVGIVITSNHLTGGIYLPADDRRHYVANSSLTSADFNDGYWTKLWRWYEQEGFAHVAAFLASYDLSGFDPKAPPPKTPAFWEIVESNVAPENIEIADILDSLGNPDAVTIDVVDREANKDLRDWFRDRKNIKTIQHRFRDCGYVVVSNPDSKKGLWTINEKRQRVYASKFLSVSDQIKAVKKLMQSEENPEQLESGL